MSTKEIILPLVTFIIFIFTSNAQNKSFEIEITNIKIGEGNVVVAISNTKEDWLEKPFKTISTKSDSETKTVSFEVPYDTYAISVYQDVIQNNEPDMNFIGAPKEPVAFGNNYKPFLGEPKFKKSSVIFNSNYQLQSLKLY